MRNDYALKRQTSICVQSKTKMNNPANLHINLAILSECSNEAVPRDTVNVLRTSVRSCKVIYQSVFGARVGELVRHSSVTVTEETGSFACDTDMIRL